MHHFNGYIFDSGRQLLYNDNIPAEVINIINANYDNTNNTPKPYDLQLNSDAMNMDQIAIDKAGVCLTYNCNLRCRYCGYSSDEGSSHRIDFADVKLFIKDIVLRRTIKKILSRSDDPLEIDFTGGGEPTYDWELFEKTILFVKKICLDNRIPLHLNLTTNGIISEQQIDFISVNFDHVMISYDGLPETQNKNRISPYKKATSPTVENTICRLANNGMPITIRSTIWQSDFDKMKEMFNYVFSLVQAESAVTWSLYPVLFEGRAVTHIKKQEDTTYGRFLEKYLELVDYITVHHGIDYLKHIEVPLFNNSMCELFCGAHRVNQPWLLPDKSIVTCIESKEDKTVIGKISDGTVQYYENYQDQLLKITQKKYNECQECIAYCICKGGCPIWHLRVDADIQEPLECCLQKEYWKYVLNSLVTGGPSLGWKLQKIAIPEAQDWEVFKVEKERQNEIK